MPSKKAVKGLSEEEKSAMRETFQERKVVWGKNRIDDERAVRAKIATFPEPDRSMAERLHALITTAGPGLSPRLWYGMPAYSKDDEVLCFFQPASKFKARYGTFGFNDGAQLDEGRMWPISYALTELTPSDEAKIAALVRKAVS